MTGGTPGAYLVGLHVASELVHLPLCTHPQLNAREIKDVAG